MKTTFFNSSYEYLMKICIQEQTYIVKPRKSITINLNRAENKIEIVPMVESKMKVSLIELYLDTVTHESIRGFIVCKYTGALKQTEDFKQFTIIENTSREKGSIYFLSVNLLPKDAEMFDVKYSVVDAKKTIRKYCVLMSLITGGIPYAILALIAVFSDFDVVAFLFLIVLLFMITIPGIKKQKDFKKNCNDSFAHHLLTLPNEKKHEVDRLIERINTSSNEGLPKPFKLIENAIVEIRGFIGSFRR